MLTYQETAEREFLQARYLVLELAAVLDRLDEAQAREGAKEDPKLRPLWEAIKVLAAKSPQPDRTERILRTYADAG